MDVVAVVTDVMATAPLLHRQTIAMKAITKESIFLIVFTRRNTGVVSRLVIPFVSMW